jgi:polar amino acid transport system substrate-binding protein
MKQIVQNFKTGAVNLEEVPVPALHSNGIIVRTIFSLISSGTEKILIDLAKMNYLQKAQERPDLVKQVANKIKNEGFVNTYKSVMQKMETPLPLGYSAVGRVMEVGQGTDDVHPGDFVACAGAGFANHAEVNFIPENLFVKIKREDKLEELAFTTLGAIAIQGIRQAEVQFGETVAVMGLGLVGQITAQVLKAAGCRVIGLEFDSSKLELARQNGLEAGIILGKDEPVSKVKEFTRGYGADKIIITASTKENEPVELAAEIARDRATIVMVGVTGMDLPRKPYYEKELNFRFSRSYGPGRYDYQYEEKGIDYPIGYVRWTERRNMEEFVRLVEEDAINIKSLITHRFSFDEALEAYQLITENPKQEKFIGVLLQYDIHKTVIPTISLAGPKGKTAGVRTGDIRVGLIGAGNFAQTVILPEFRKLKGVSFIGACSARGIHAAALAKKHGFKYVTGDYQEILNDPEINLVVISTTHNLHFSMAQDAMNRGKDVYVEKPLCMNESELESLKQFMAEHPECSLLVGFNRRFSKHIEGIKSCFRNNRSPYLINYRVNAGNIPKGHWINDPEIGGGRIVGEVCHFIDLTQYITGARPIQVYTQKMAMDRSDVINEDNICCTISYDDGSLASLIYTSVGDKSYPKEKLEVFCNGAAASCDNFIRTRIWNHGRLVNIKTPGIDKGFSGLYSGYISYLRGKAENPIPLDEIFQNTLTTFKVKESLQKNIPIQLIESKG